MLLWPAPSLLPSPSQLRLTSLSSRPGEELIYLDPHTTQPAVELTDSCFIPDESFHCQHPPCRMSIGELDPSIAVVCSNHANSQEVVETFSARPAVEYKEICLHFNSFLEC